MVALSSKHDVYRLAASLFLLTTLPAPAAPAETPETFVRRVYARYRTLDSPGVPMDRPGGAAFYTPALLDAFSKGLALADGKTGAIDSDPICACQTNGPLRLKKVTIAKGAADTVQARVNFDYLSYKTLHDAPKATPETVLLTLSRTPFGWRIADVGNKAMKSVMAVLYESIAQPDTPKPK